MMFSTSLHTFILAVSALPSNVARTTTDYQISFVNECGTTVWPAGWQTDTTGGILASEYMGTELAANETWQVSVPNTAFGLQFWARQECTGSASSDDFSCAVGDCGGFLCTELNWQGGVILAELGAGTDTSVYNTDITAYDLSAIGGQNVKPRNATILD